MLKLEARRLWDTMLYCFLVFCLAYAFRARAATYLPLDFDEPIYSSAAIDYHAAISRRDWSAVADYNKDIIHPPLSKLVYAVALFVNLDLPLFASSPAGSRVNQTVYSCRKIAVLAGALQAAIIALLSPLAALFLSVHTIHIKYTSQAYLDYLPSLLSLVSVISYLRFRHSGNSLVWLTLSGISLGASVGSKYYYGLCGTAVAVDWLLTELSKHSSLRSWPRFLRLAFFWCSCSLATFYASNPLLWHKSSEASLSQLNKSVEGSVSYAASSPSDKWGYSRWEPVRWLSRSVPWHGDTIPIRIDGLISFLALFGFIKLWRQDRVWALWIVLGLVFLVAWPVKWPHYVLLLLSPWMLSAALGAEVILRWLCKMKAKLTMRLKT